MPESLHNEQFDRLIEKMEAIEKAGNTQEQRIQQVIEKVEEVKKKLADKWVLPVLLSVLTAVLALTSYFIQRWFNNADVGKQKQQEIAASFVAESKVNFYKQCRLELNEINIQFESYCIVGMSEEVEITLDSLVAHFTQFVANQQVIDQKILVAVKSYSEYVAEQTFDMKSNKPGAAERKKIFEEGKSLLGESIAMLDKGIQQIQKP